MKKYREVLESHGILLPDPRKSSEYRWFSSATKFAIVCEQNDGLSTQDVAELVDWLDHQGRFSVEEYRDALPDEMAERTDLKIDDAFDELDP